MNSLKQEIYEWICLNPGRDSEDVAEHFNISHLLSANLVGELLDDGKLGYDE